MPHSFSIHSAGRIAAFGLALGLLASEADAAKGIVKSVNVVGGTGVIVVTEKVGAGSGEVGDSLPFSFMAPSPALASDLVSFDIVDLGMGNEADSVTLVTTGTLILSPVGNLAVGAGQAVMIVGTSVNGTVTVSGDGVLLVTNGSAINGKIVSESPSTLVVQQTFINGIVVSLPPSCPADSTGPDDLPDGLVGILDFLRVLSDWGSCSSGAF